MQQFEIIDIGKRLYAHEFVSAFDGNISCRTAQNSFLITASAVCKGELEPDNILEIDSFGNILNGSGKISTETKLHLHIYKKRSDVNAVIHAHPIYSTAFASTRCSSLDEPVFPETVLTIGRIPLCRYAMPSSDDLGTSLDPFLDYATVFLLENHGAVATGKSLLQAYFRLEKLEHTAKTIFISRMLGGEKRLPNSAVQELYHAANKTYGIFLHDKNKF